MKTLGLLLLAIIGTVGFLRWREANLERQEAARVREEAAIVEVRASKRDEPAEPQHSGNFVTTRDAAGNYRTRELAPGVSYGQSIGNGSAGPVKATPKPRTMLDRGAYDRR